MFASTSIAAADLFREQRTSAERAQGLLPEEHQQGDWCNAIVNADVQHPYYSTKPTFANPFITTTGTLQSGANKKTIIAVAHADVLKISTNQSIKDTTTAAISIHWNLSRAQHGRQYGCDQYRRQSRRGKPELDNRMADQRAAARRESRRQRRAVQGDGNWTARTTG